MAENLRPPESYNDRRQELWPTDVVSLHHETIQVPTGIVPVIPAAEALQREVKLIFAFPSGDERRSPIGVGVVDYGEGVEQRPVPYLMVEGRAYKGLGSVNTRYGLRTLVRTPEDEESLHIGHVPLPIGREFTLGSDKSNRANSALGLAKVENTRISPEHLTVALDGETFKITDDSEYGTQLIFTDQPRYVFWEV